MQGIPPPVPELALPLVLLPVLPLLLVPVLPVLPVLPLLLVPLLLVLPVLPLAVIAPPAVLADVVEVSSVEDVEDVALLDPPAPEVSGRMSNFGNEHEALPAVAAATSAKVAARRS